MAPRSQDQNFMIMHIYPSWILPRYKLATLPSIPWTQQGSRESEGQDHGSKVKGHRTKFYAHLSIMGSPQTQTGHVGIHTLHWRVYKNPKVKVMAPRPKVTGQKCMPMHIYPSWVVHRHKLATLASIIWTQH